MFSKSKSEILETLINNLVKVNAPDKQIGKLQLKLEALKAKEKKTSKAKETTTKEIDKETEINTKEIRNKKRIYSAAAIIREEIKEIYYCLEAMKFDPEPLIYECEMCNNEMNVKNQEEAENNPCCSQECYDAQRQAGKCNWKV